MSSPRVFITGGASGLGRALAERYARAGARVCIADIHEARGQETLAALGAQALWRRCDVRSDEDLRAAADHLVSAWGGVDVVVNNAGVAVGGSIEDVPLADWQWIVDINLMGVVRGCKAFVPILRRQGHGHIVNVASMAGLLHLPMMSAYNATKAAVVALSETLRAELEPDGVHVSVVCPSFFRTNLTETLRASNGDVARQSRQLVDEAKLGAHEVAALVHRGLELKRAHVLTHADAKVVWALKRALPFTVFARVFKALAQR